MSFTSAPITCKVCTRTTTAWLIYCGTICQWCGSRIPFKHHILGKYSHMFIHRSSCFRNYCWAGHLEVFSHRQKCLLIWGEICCHLHQPSAGKLSSFKTSISTCPPTFCSTGSPPHGSGTSLPLGKRKQRRTQESRFAWKQEWWSWVAKPTAAIHF